jgi:enoyl-CoA hydratase
MGLITVATNDVSTTVAELTSAIAQGSPQGLAASKALTTAAIIDDFDSRAEKLTQESAALFVSAEAREGMSAFLAKRSPSWIG